MRSQTITFVALVGILSIILNTSSARDFNDLTKDATYMTEVINCVLDNVICDEYGLKVKAMIPEVLNNNCKHCDPDQRRKFKMMSAFMKMAYPRQWKQIQAKYQGNRNVNFNY